MPRSNDPSLVRISLDVPVAMGPAAEAAAYATGVQGLELVDEEVGGRAGRLVVRLYAPSGAAAARAVRRLRALPGAVVSLEDVRLEAAGEPRTLPGAVVSLEDVRREAAVEARARPRLLGRRFVVCAPPLPPPRRGGRTPLALDGSRAFGDGLHPTTRLVVARLERLFAERRFRRVLDVGTGTGVLALIAAYLGAGSVVATDVDPLARDAARRAVRLHDLEGRVSVRARMPRESYGLVVANLYRDALLGLAPALAARVAPGGVLVVSGFPGVAAAAIVEAFSATGLAVRERVARGAWGLLELAPARRCAPSVEARRKSR